MDKQLIKARHWLETKVVRGWREAGPLYRIARGLGYIGGSFAAWMSNDNANQPVPNDIDIFAISENAATLISQRIYNQWDCAIIDNGFVHSIQFTKRRIPVQVIRPHPDWKKFPDDIIHSFDLDICRALLVDRDKLLIDENVGSKYAKILRVADPVKTMERIIKYAQRGVIFQPNELLKVCRAWAELSEARRAQIEAQIYKECFQDIDTYPDYGYVDEDDYWDAE